MTNSATATAARAVVISMIRWGTLSRNARGAVPGAPFVIVVTSLWGWSRQAQSLPDQLTPLQLTPLQLTPDQLTPLQLTPDHDTPDQLTPDQGTPDQLTPDQDTPLQLTPDQLTPLQLTPFQLVPFLRPAAQFEALKLRPRMSVSPRTSRPATVTCTEPRESSREPTPVESAKDCFAFTGVAVSLAFARSSRPAPCCAAVAPGTAAADPVRRALTWSGVSSGRCE